MVATGNAALQCSTSETLCASIGDINEQREYIGTCDGYLIAQASVDGGPAVCK